MSELRMVAIASELAENVRATKLSPGYGHPVTAKVAMGHGPCRHCLRPFAIGSDVRLLFTLDPFDGVAPIPQPGPVFVHEEACERYAEESGIRLSCCGSAWCWMGTMRSRWSGGASLRRMDRRRS